MHSPKIFFLSAALLALSAMAGCNETAAKNGETINGIPVRKHQRADSVRVVTANIRQTLEEDYKTGNGWNDRRQLCRDVLLAQGADIFSFQECRAAQLAWFKEAMPEFEFFGIGNPPKTASAPEPSNAIFYSTKRFQKIDSGGFWLSETPDEPGSKLPDSSARFANWVRLKDKVAGREFIVWNTHLHHVGEKVRERQMEILLGFTKKVSASIPQILTGDFNTSAEGPVVALVKDAGWIDSYAEINGPKDPGGTAHRFLGPGFLNTDEGRKRRKIDFIFHNSPFKAIASEVIYDSRDGRYPSDHYFGSAELVYSK